MEIKKRGRGRPKKTPEPVVKIDNPMVDIGHTGLKKSFGIINEEFLVELKGLRGVRTYREMQDNDDMVGAILFSIDMLMRGVEWHAEPEDETKPEDIEAAEYLDSVMDDMNVPWSDFISEVLSMLPFGWSYFEKVFKVRSGRDAEPRSKHSDGLIGWRKLAIRGQETLERWGFDENGGILGMRQHGDLYGLTGNSAPVFIPIEKALLFRTKISKNNPEGRSVLRNAYRSWYFKKNIEQIEGIGIERDLAGLPVMYIPTEILNAKAGSAESRLLDAFKKTIRNVRRDEQEGVLMPQAYDKNGNKMFEFELLSTGGSRQFDTVKVKLQYSRGIAMTVLADFILLGHEKVGSFALASSKTKLFAVAIGGWLNSIADTLNRHGVEQLLHINNMKGRAILAHGDVETRDLKEVATYVESLTRVGALLPDDNLENKLRALGGLPSIQAEVMETGGRSTRGEPEESEEEPEDLE